MPKASKPRLNPLPNIRRSSRLNKLQDNQDVAHAPIERSQPRRRIKVVSSCDNDNLPPVPKMHNLSNPARSQRMTPEELLKREKALHCKEQECKRMTGEIQERMLSLSRKEDMAFSIMSRIEERNAQAILTQLEEHFTCTLCYEIIAHPYALNPVQCGHTFCAICILRWFFARLHRNCGRWHEAVDCPICRSLLVLTPDQVPRLEITFPFVPNRTAAAVCESLIEKLAKSQSDALDVERAPGSGSKKKSPGIAASDNLREKKIPDDADVTAWREGGHMRAEWLKRDSEGRKEMNYILKSWPTLKSEDFLTLQQKFGSNSHTS